MQICIWLEQKRSPNAIRSQAEVIYEVICCLQAQFYEVTCCLSH